MYEELAVYSRLLHRCSRLWADSTDSWSLPAAAEDAPVFAAVRASALAANASERPFTRSGYVSILRGKPS